MDPRQQLTLDRATVWCQEKKSLVVVTIIVSEARALCRSIYVYSPGVQANLESPVNYHQSAPR